MGFYRSLLLATVFIISALTGFLVSTYLDPSIITIYLILILTGTISIFFIFSRRKEVTPEKRKLLFLHSVSKIEDPVRGIQQQISTKISIWSEKISRISHNPITYISRAITLHRLAVYGTASAAFIFAFWAQWNFSYHYVIADGGLAAIIQKFNVLLDEGLTAILNGGVQINNYTGNPFFLLPVVLLFGYSPDAVHIALIGSQAAAVMIFFLAYYRLFDFKKAFLGILLLLSMSQWLYYRWIDYTYSLFLVSILLYLYIDWSEKDLNPRSPHTYLLAFFGGLFFYFKATILYLLIGLGLASSYNKGTKILRKINLPVLILLFLLGASPFLAYSTIHSTQIEESGGSTWEVALGGPASLGPIKAVVGRFDQLGRWLYSDLYRLDYILPQSEDDFLSPPLEPNTAPGEEFQDIEILSVLTDTNYEKHYYNGVLHPFSILLLIAIATLLYTRKYASYAITFLTMFFLLIFLPSTSGFRVSHMHILVPFVPLLLLAPLDLIPDKLRSSIPYRVGYIILVISLITSIGLTVSALSDTPHEGTYDAWGGEPRKWAGDQDFHNDFESLEIDGLVLTNSYKVYITTYYFRDIPSVYLLPANMSRDTDENNQYLSPSDFVRHRTSIDEIENYFSHTSINTSKPFNLVIRENLPCQSGSEFCGASVEEVGEELNLSENKTSYVTLSGDSFILVRDTSIQ